MNLPALDEALRELADGPSNATSVRSTLHRRHALRRQARRTSALLGAAAAVVLIIGAIGLIAVTRNNSQGVATPPDWRRDHPIVIPAGSQLIPYDAPALLSPVTVTAGGPPAGVLAQRSIDADTLRVDWPNADYDSPAFRGSLGYVIDRSADFGRMVSRVGGVLPVPEQVTTVPGTVGGHPARFGRAPADRKVTDDSGALFRVWFTWQLSDGKYIHVWNTPDDKAALSTLAAGIVEKPSPLPSFMSFGVTLPGLTVPYSTGVRYLNQSTTAPLTEESGLCPTGSVSVLTARARCLIATVEPVAPDGYNVKRLADGEHVQVGGTLAHVVAKDRLAWTALGRGYVAVVIGPVGMSTPDLALAAAAVRIDPEVGTAPVPATGPPVTPSGLAPASVVGGTGPTAVPQSR